uniref:Uncharacterized protein n=1 Tax=Trichuris muris TaxID=70415 RepID=A0A5S6QZB5_TRIMR
MSGKYVLVESDLTERWLVAVDRAKPLMSGLRIQRPYVVCNAYTTCRGHAAMLSRLNHPVDLLWRAYL